ncbi:MAG: hypothetical protein AAF842_09565, partial [Planctomycetota bacterium]
RALDEPTRAAVAANCARVVELLADTVAMVPKRGPDADRLHAAARFVGLVYHRHAVGEFRGPAIGADVAAFDDPAADPPGLEPAYAAPDPAAEAHDYPYVLPGQVRDGMTRAELDTALKVKMRPRRVARKAAP